MGVVLVLVLVLGGMSWLCLVFDLAHQKRRDKSQSPEFYLIRSLTEQQRIALCAAGLLFPRGWFAHVANDGDILAVVQVRQVLKILKARVIRRLPLSDRRIEELILEYAPNKNRASINNEAKDQAEQERQRQRSDNNTAPAVAGAPGFFTCAYRWLNKWNPWGGAPDNSGNVFVHDFAGPQLKVLKSVVGKVFQPVVKGNVHVHDGQGTNHVPIMDGNFHIFINSSASGRPCLDLPNTVAGYRTETAHKAFAPSTAGLPLVDDLGFIFGELLECNLYLHFDAIGSGSRSAKGLVAKLLGTVCTELAGFQQMTIAQLDTRVAAQFEKECQQQIALSGYPDKQLDGLADSLNKSQVQFQQVVQNTMEAQRALVLASPDSQLGTEFDAIWNMPKVRGIEVRDRDLVVTTDALCCTDTRSGVLHCIGAFDIHIPFRADEAVRWLNRSRLCKNMNAPHVDGEGYACLGNMKDVFPALINAREFAAAIEAAIAFVETANVEDKWGSQISYWPIAASVSAQAQPAPLPEPQFFP